MPRKRKPSKPPSLLAKFYNPLPLPWVKKTFFRLSKGGHPDDANHFLHDCVKADPMVLNWVVWPHYDFKPFHRSWQENLIYNMRSGTFAPRGHGKTSSTTRSIIPWALINDRDMTCASVSSRKNTAKRFCKSVRAVLENEWITYLFGGFRSDNWLKEEFTVAGRSKNIDDPSLVALAADGGMTSLHPLFVVIDDSVDINHRKSATIRMQHAEFVGAVLSGAVKAATQLAVAGTLYHPDDWHSKILRSERYVLNHPSTRRCFLDWAPGKHPFEMSKCLWPELYTPEFFHNQLRGDEAMSLPHFKLAYFNDPHLDEGKIWRKNMFMYSGDSYDGDVIISVDTAYKEKSKNDFTAIVILRKLAQNGMILVEKTDHGHWGPTYAADKIEQYHKQYVSRGVIIEDWVKNAVAAREGHALADILRTTKQIPCQTVKPQVDKTTRYYNAVKWWEQLNVIHRPELKDGPMERQMLAAPGDNEFDDILDALVQGIAYFDAGGVPTVTFERIAF